MDMSEKIKALLSERGMSNIELSRAAGIPNSTLADMLKCKTTNVSINAAIRVASALGVTVEHLILDEDDSPKQKPAAQGDGLSSDKEHIIDMVRSLDDRQAKIARGIIDVLIQKDTP